LPEDAPPPRPRRRGGLVLAVSGLVLLLVAVAVRGGSPDPNAGLGGVPAEPTTYTDGHYAFMQMQPDGSAVYGRSMDGRPALVDPKNAALRDIVKADFTARSENYQKIMEKARDYSNQANELYKETLKKQRGQ